MKLIAHRGNFAGQNTERENTVAYLEEALAAGYDVEFDVRMLSTKKGLFLGHDSCIEKVPSTEWLRDSRKWVHCKDMASFVELSKYPDIQCFMHDDEKYALPENTDKIWVHSAHMIPDGWDNRKERAIVHETYVFEPIEDVFAIYGYNVSKFKHLQDELWNINTILLDVDGVMTNGKKIYDMCGNTIHKEFCDKDWTAIKRMKAAGLRVIMISSDEWNEEIAIRRNVEWIYSHTTGPASKLNELRRLGVDLSKCIYIGDDYYDIELLVHAGGSWCPEDAIQEVKDVACVIPAKGGENCVAAFYQQIKHHLRENFPHEQ